MRVSRLYRDRENEGVMTDCNSTDEALAYDKYKGGKKSQMRRGISIDDQSHYLAFSLQC